uniref:Reticulon-4-interacting protein 1 n=1 Tax=Ascaris suum TaxID=6253 RepID=F1KYA1_ASCSU
MVKPRSLLVSCVLTVSRRGVATATVAQRRHSTTRNMMDAWVTSEFGAPMVKSAMRIPEVSSTDELLLKVKAASVNPIDTVMRNGYGRTIISLCKQIENKSLAPLSILPFIGGRDCSAVVEYAGQSVSKFRRGDEVMAVIGPTYAGSHAEYVLAKECWCAPKPRNISHVEAAALPYVSCTAWTALVSVARINAENAHGQHVLIHGGAGGVGTAAIQLLKAWNVGKLVATCSADSFKLVSSVGAKPIDYRSETVKDELKSEGPFDVILDCVDSELARWSDNVMGIWRNSVHVTVVSPTLRETDSYGIPFGLASTAMKYLTRSVDPAWSGRWFAYAYFAPNEECLNFISGLLANGKMKAIVDQTYSFDELPAAYEKVAQRHGRGKTVVDFDKH